MLLNLPTVRTVRSALSRFALIPAIAALGLGLAGCSGIHTINSNVQSYSTLSELPNPATYRLQLLPSQINNTEFANVVQQAETSLAGVGLKRDDAQGALVAQINAQSRYIPDSWLLPGSPYNPYGGFGWWGMGFGGRGMMWRDTGPSLHYRAVQLNLRDYATQQVVYETSAVYEDVWVNDQIIFRILFDSALNGFPKPPPGPRTVSATIGAQPAASKP